MCSYFNADADVQTPRKTKSILLTHKDAAALLEIPLGLLYHLVSGKAIHVGDPNESVIRMSAAEILRIKEAIKNLPTRTYNGLKRKHWEGLEGALKTASELAAT